MKDIINKIKEPIPLSALTIVVISGIFTAIIQADVLKPLNNNSTEKVLLLMVERGFTAIYIVIILSFIYGYLTRKKTARRKKKEAKSYLLLKVLIAIFFVIALAAFIYYFIKSDKTTISSSKNYILRENFDDNMNSWDLRKTVRLEAKIQQGFLALTSNREALFPKIITIPSLETKYKIETRLAFQSKSSASKLGLEWGSDYNSQIPYGLFFLLNGNGEHAIGKNQKGKIIYNKAWSPTNGFHINDFNTLSVNRKGSLIEFQINGSLVHQEVFDSPIGHDIGLLIADTEGIIDYLYILE